MRLTKAIFINRAPFENLELNFDNSNIFVLSGINGKGKTTVLSYIVDSFYELAKKEFENEFEYKENKFYRVSSDIDMLDASKPSIVYLRFKYNDKYFDYIDIRGKCDDKTYNSLITLDNKISFNSIGDILSKNDMVKWWTKFDIEKTFSSGIYTYFPAYRYETPNYLNDPYKVHLQFKTESDFSGFLANPLEVTSDLSQIANWLMDVVLDSQIYSNDIKTKNIRLELNSVFSTILMQKVKENVRLGIGRRNNSAQRIAIMSDRHNNNDVMIYPSIFLMSSGELALVSLFVELIKQSDKINNLISDVSGVVLIDEVDKHLHISLQKEVLPKLINLFPNIQFIVASHSPFFTLGLSENGINHKIFDFDNNGILCFAQNNDLFKDVYESMINENNRFADKYNSLKNEIEKSTKPLIITEGKTDWKHLKKAKESLQLCDVDCDFYEFEDSMANSKLKTLLENCSLIKQQRKIIGIFDRDVDLKIKDFDNREYSLRQETYVNLGNNVYCFMIPVPGNSHSSEPDNISIEHYYTDDEIKRQNEEGQRLFMGNEFDKYTGNHKTLPYHYHYIENLADTIKIIEHETKKYVFEIGSYKNLSLSKERFVEAICGDKANFDNFDFSEFNKIFDIIRDIIKL